MRKGRGKIRFGLAIFGGLHMDQPEPVTLGVPCSTSVWHKPVLGSWLLLWCLWVEEEPR